MNTQHLFFLVTFFSLVTHWAPSVCCISNWDRNCHIKKLLVASLFVDPTWSGVRTPGVACTTWNGGRQNSILCTWPITAACRRDALGNGVNFPGLYFMSDSFGPKVFGEEWICWQDSKISALHSVFKSWSAPPQHFISITWWAVTFITHIRH